METVNLVSGSLSAIAVKVFISQSSTTLTLQLTGLAIYLSVGIARRRHRLTD
ncbi:hypothetical protein [Nostoc sp.]|uniref:hypothetical protein n=1 Tax=Nostoc sp. TaxID=1180 RepID=UPI002FFB24FE